MAIRGAEANENALKIARQCTGRHKVPPSPPCQYISNSYMCAQVITRYRSYHGASHGAIALTGDPRRWPNEPGGLMGGVVRVFDPYKYRSLLYREGMPDQEFSHLMVQQLEETIQYEGPDNIAAMFLETVTGTNGLLPPPEGYLRGVREVLSKYGILMVCDEVMCGLGRTGAWFAVDHWGVVPDIITMAKGVTSAYLPLGVVAMSAQVAAAFDNKAYSGGLTYNGMYVIVLLLIISYLILVSVCPIGHPMCLAAGVAALRVLEEERLVERAHSMGAIMGEHLENMKHKHVSVGDVRYIGLFGTMELVKNRATKESLAPFNGTHPSIAAMNKLIKDKGLYMFCHWNLLHTNPPLVITKVRDSYYITLHLSSCSICTCAILHCVLTTMRY